jgi:hypothetical protein
MRLGLRQGLVIFALAASGLLGCATTQPYERDRLADPTMQLDDDGDRHALRGHVRGTREGAIGGDGAGGGGCGCN